MNKTDKNHYYVFGKIQGSRLTGLLSMDDSRIGLKWTTSIQPAQFIIHALSIEGAQIFLGSSQSNPQFNKLTQDISSVGIFRVRKDPVENVVQFGHHEPSPQFSIITTEVNLNKYIYTIDRPRRGVTESNWESMEHAVFPFMDARTVFPTVADAYAEIEKLKKNPKLSKQMISEFGANSIRIETVHFEQVMMAII